jgi:UDP-N-acetylmuramoyl-L-alanyl-D-glutamate--2,6-diaminopimelate ligase
VLLQQLFSDMLDAGCGCAVMEVSSHALVQHRTGTASFSLALFTNLSGEHLDYHKDMESYYQAKKLLFTSSLASGGAAVINTDDNFGKRLYLELAGICGNLFSLGTGGGEEFTVSDIELKPDFSSFRLNSEEFGQLSLITPLTGRFNIYNAAAAAAAALVSGIDADVVRAGIRTARGAPGRMEKCLDKPLVFVDYAHTDDALKNVLSALSAILGGRFLTVVFGCGGDRDRSKRPRMGAAAAEFADRIVLTTDNPRTENPEAIFDDIISGIPEGVSYEVISDRRSAINYAVRNSPHDGVVLIAGKGHETYQEIDGVKFPFNDREEVLKCASFSGGGE